MGFGYRRYQILVAERRQVLILLDIGLITEGAIGRRRENVADQ